MARYRRLPEAAVDAALARVDLAGRGRDAFKSYSLGMKQRLGVASALLGEPELLVLDEPTNGLDPAGMAEMRELLVDVAAGGQTVILSSHLLGEVQEICDQVGVISDGRLMAESTVAGLRGEAAVLLRADPLDRALAVAMRVAGDDAVAVVDDGRAVRVQGGAPVVPALTRALVAEDVDVREIRTVERSLEEVFLEMTGTGANGELR
jgi:ABC-2 type transport system ATP-binding protein